MPAGSEIRAFPFDDWRSRQHVSSKSFQIVTFGPGDKPAQETWWPVESTLPRREETPVGPGIGTNWNVLLSSTDEPAKQRIPSSQRLFASGFCLFTIALTP